MMRAAAAEEGIEFAESVPVDTENLYLNQKGFVSALDNILGDCFFSYTIIYYKQFLCICLGH